MNRPFAVLTILALSSCTGTDVAHAPEPMPPTAPSDPVLHAAVMRDLSLELSLTGPAQTEESGQWPLAVKLTNHGATSHAVVRAQDGSDAGWREPHVFYSMDVREPSGRWVPAQTQEMSRCGNYASAWMRDVTEIAAGESMPVEDYTPAQYAFDFERSAHVRVFAHYAWEGGVKRSFDWSGPVDDQAPQPTLPHELRAVGPYELVSNPVELDVHVDRPIDVGVNVHHTRISSGHYAVKDFLDAWAESASTNDEDLGEDTFGSRFMLEGRLAGRTRMMIELAGPATIAPERRVALTTSGTHDLDFDAPGRWQLRVRYEALRSRTSDVPSTVRRSRSAWVDVDVTP